MQATLQYGNQASNICIIIVLQHASFCYMLPNWLVCWNYVKYAGTPVYLGRACPSMVRNGTCIKFTKIYRIRTVCSTLFAEWYVRLVHENLLKEYSLIAPHCCWMVRTSRSWTLAVPEWYVCLVHENLLKEYHLPHTVAEWYVHFVHEDLPIKNGLLHTIDHEHDTWLLNMAGGRQRRAEETPEKWGMVTDIQ